MLVAKDMYITIIFIVYYTIKKKETRIIKNCEFKKGSRDRSPQQKVRKQEPHLQIQILVKFTRFNSYFVRKQELTL